MRKRLRIISVALLLALCLIGSLSLTACSKNNYTYTPLDVTVRYLKNIDGEEDVFSSGREFIGEDLLYYQQTLKSNEKIVPPENPTRSGYTFVGWTTDKEGKSELFDFTAPITGSINLYAKWKRAEGNESGGDNYVEPTLTFQEKIDEKQAFLWEGVCNQPISESEVDLTTAGINRLKAKASDVKELLNYKRASSTVIQSATFNEADMTVSVTYKAGSAAAATSTVKVNDITESLKFVDNSSTKMDESTFETKARNYEKTDFDGNASYKVVLGGSSSMENWSDSGEVMNPVTTKNVGIGGSASYQWTESLADRLIIPYNPRAVVLYVGINDIINYGKKGDTTAYNLIDLFEHIHERLPDATIHFILINHVPGYYKTYKNAIDTANNRVIEYAEEEGHEYLNIIDAGTVLEKEAGSHDYSEAYFLTDGLHMSQAGYILWGAEVKKAVIAKDKEKYNG